MFYNMRKGLFITFEGADGTGKTTQLEKIKKSRKCNSFRLFRIYPAEQFRPASDGFLQAFQIHG